MSKNNSDRSSRRGIIIVTVIILAVISLVLSIFIRNGLFEKNNIMGNSYTNIRNFGYAAYQKGWLYYVSPTDDSISNVGIFKSRINGKSKKLLKPEGWKDSWNVMSLNVVGDYIYFITTEKMEVVADTNSDTIEKDNIDNRIYKMKIDGTDLKLINDNDFYYESYGISVVNDKIYYIGNDINIYSMDLNGENRTALSNKATGYLAINEKYILYNDYPQEITESTTNNDMVTYIMNIDGSEPHVVNGKKLVSACIIGDYIYYTNDDKYLCKVKLDGSDDTVLVEKGAYNLTHSDKFLYYFTYKDVNNNDFTVCLNRVSLNDNKETVLKELSNYSQFLNVVKDNAFYMDSKDGYGYINIFDYQKGTTTELFKIDYKNITDSSVGK